MRRSWHCNGAAVLRLYTARLTQTGVATSTGLCSSCTASSWAAAAQALTPTTSVQPAAGRALAEHKAMRHACAPSMRTQVMKACRRQLLRRLHDRLGPDRMRRNF